MPNKGNTLVLS